MFNFLPQNLLCKLTQTVCSTVLKFKCSKLIEKILKERDKMTDGKKMTYNMTNLGIIN